jgi:hypothetical protein
LEGEPIGTRLAEALRPYNVHLPFQIGGSSALFPGLDTYLGLHDGFRNWGTLEGMNDAKPGSVPGWQLWGHRIGMPALLGLTAVGNAGVGGIFRGGGGCFVSGTSVLLGDRTSKPIQEIRAGDKVASRNELTGKDSLKQVTRTFVHTVTDLVKLELKGEKGSKEVQTLRGTLGHPFYVVDVGFVAMGQLKPGMKVITRRGPPLVVKSVEWEQHPEGVTVYNFEVADDHTYFVGTIHGGAWVHNISGFMPYRGEAGAARSIREGAESVHVNTREQAERILRKEFQMGDTGVQWHDATSFDAYSSARYCMGRNGEGFYHWDEAIGIVDDVPNRLMHHPLGHPHSQYRHLQIEWPDGRTIQRINFGPQIW